MRVLVVEDDAANREVMQMVLELAGHTVSIAGTGREAIERVAEDNPEAVFLDLRLPDQSGESVSRALREGPSVPRIIITSGMTIDAAEAARLGADAVLQKPFGPEQLLEALK